MNETETTSCVSSPSPPTSCVSSPSPSTNCVTSPSPPVNCVSPSSSPTNCVSSPSPSTNYVSSPSPLKSVLCVESVDTYLIETPATVGVPWVDVTPDDAGKFLSNDGERAYWQTVAYSEENFTTALKVELESLISGDYSWKENQW